MAASKPEVPISKLVDKIGSKLNSTVTASDVNKDLTAAKAKARTKDFTVYGLKDSTRTWNLCLLSKLYRAKKTISTSKYQNLSAHDCPFYQLGR